MSEPEPEPVVSTCHPRLSELAQEAIPARQRLVDEKYIVPAEELAMALGVKPDSLQQAVAENRVFVLEVGPSKYFPAFYAHPAFRRQDLERVSRVLSNLSGWNKWQFFMRRNAGLGDLSPLEALERGRLEEVMDAAHAYIGR